ncbi:MAG: hypothetical protein M9894_32315 [Planctomycetes bacterium]|nr:hypothetical protein [Planctomycetota bacterium]
MAVDFEAIWHTHKRFILQVAGGALAFSVLLGWQGGIAAAATRAAKANAGQQAELQDDLAGLLGAEGLEKGRAAALAERLEPAVLDALLWRADEGFVLPKGEKAGAMFYSQAAGKAASDVARHAQTWNAQVPTTSQALGLVTEPDEARLPEALAQADLARRLVIRLLDAGVRNVTRVELPDASYVARDGERGFLRLLPARVTFRARTETLARALGELQVAGSFVEVLGCTVTRERGAGEPLLVELEVQALATVEQAPVAAVSAGTPAGGRRGPRRFGRER